VSRRPVATVRILRRPDLHPEAVRVEVDCPASTTGLTSIPNGAIKLGRAQLVTAATFEHERRCGHCDTNAAHAQGDQAIRSETDRVFAAHRERQMRAFSHSVRN
jgi:hypothetical protein